MPLEWDPVSTAIRFSENLETMSIHTLLWKAVEPRDPEGHGQFITAGEYDETDFYIAVIAAGEDDETDFCIAENR
ncbi:hypothetical protein L6452_40117 [Arctium lappa]|uniref:Uncharacterized protein n=1 Tax=Arctium lappa TaxID=4217 RepID=A0ACB8XM83_ARCLA|nr:hypothetical protein L6452_40117 [Arctium lappa]